MPKTDPRPARKRQRSKGRPSARPTSKECQQALDEIDTLRLELIRKDQTIAQLQAEVRTKDQTIDHLELNDGDKTKRMDDLHDQPRRRQPRPGGRNQKLEVRQAAPAREAHEPTALHHRPDPPDTPKDGRCPRRSPRPRYTPDE